MPNPKKAHPFDEAIKADDAAQRHFLRGMIEDTRTQKPAKPSIVYAAVLITQTEGGALERRCVAADVDAGDGENKGYIESVVRDGKALLRPGEELVLQRFQHTFVHGDL